MPVSKPTGVRVLLLRHAMSTWNEEGRFQGRGDPPLAASATAEIEAVVRLLPSVGHISTSPQRRALETAVRLAALLARPTPDIDPLLRERDVGPWEGLTRSEIEVTWPGYLES